MNDAENSVWNGLWNDICKDLLAIHIPVIDDKFIIDFIEDQKDWCMPYVGYQGYKR